MKMARIRHHKSRRVGQNRTRQGMERSYRGHFSPFPFFILAYSLLLSLSLSWAVYISLPFASSSDPRRRSSGPWVVAVPYLFSPMATVCVFHRLEILFAFRAAKLSRFEIFMNGSVRTLYTTMNKDFFSSVIFIISFKILLSNSFFFSSM